MNEGSSSEKPGAHVPDAAVRKSSRFSAIWMFPLVAAVIGAMLFYRTLSEKGPTIKLSFETAAGLEAGKTTLRYREVEIGLVDEIHVVNHGSHVEATLEVVKAASSVAVEGSRFWVVRPRVGEGGITGLGTLVSGAYIDVDPGPPDGPRVRSFKGLEKPPLDLKKADELRLVLTADRLSGVGAGSAIYYRDIRVGQVEQHELAEDGKAVVIHASVQDQYVPLVTESTKFWNASGIDVSAGLTGVEVRLESLQSVLRGGLAFDTWGSPGKAVEDGASFTLYASHNVARRAYQSRGGLHVVVEAPRLGSLKVGNPVYYREEQVGHVLSHELHADGRSVGVLLKIDSHYAPLVRTNTRFWNASGISADLGLHGLHVHAESLAAMLEGGLGFATPDSPGPRAKYGSVFKLHDEVNADWLKWSPRIWISGQGKDPKAKDAPPEKSELVHHKEAAHKESHHWFKSLFHRGGDSDTE